MIHVRGIVNVLTSSLPRFRSETGNLQHRIVWSARREIASEISQAARVFSGSVYGHRVAAAPTFYLYPRSPVPLPGGARRERPRCRALAPRARRPAPRAPRTLRLAPRALSCELDSAAGCPYPTRMRSTHSTPPAARLLPIGAQSAQPQRPRDARVLIGYAN